jgi:sulfotransferase family protein
VRRATVPLRPLPDFVIMGMQGCGTTSTYAWLSEHPQIRPAAKKELHYFDFHYDRGMTWYRSQFPFLRKGMITGEATPYLFLHPLAPARVARDLPDSTTFILLLRDPADRAISRYHRAVSRGKEPETLERALALEGERLAADEDAVMSGAISRGHQKYSYVTGGLYATLLRQWHQHVAPERIVTFESEALFRSAEVRSDLLTALGVGPHDVEFPFRNSSAPTEKVDADAAIREQLREYFRPHNEELFELLGRRFWGQ